MLKSSLLRAAARSVLVDRGFKVRVKPGQGYLPGSRVVAEKNGKEMVVAVKASKERVLSFTRQSDDLWRTLHAVGLVLAAVPDANDADVTEFLAFKKKTLVAEFDRAWKALEKEKRPLSFKIPVFIPLDEVARKNVGHNVGNLKRLGVSYGSRTLEQIRAMNSADTEEDYVDAFISRYAKDHRIEEHQVFIGITGRRK